MAIYIPPDCGAVLELLEQRIILDLKTVAVETKFDQLGVDHAGCFGKKLRIVLTLLSWTMLAQVPRGDEMVNIPTGAMRLYFSAI